MAQDLPFGDENELLKPFLEAPITGHFWGDT